MESFAVCVAAEWCPNPNPVEVHLMAHEREQQAFGRGCQYALEQQAALEAINARALPFKPLPPEIEAWMMQFEELRTLAAYRVLATIASTASMK